MIITLHVLWCEETACNAFCRVLQSLLTAQWPLELQHNKHSCVKQLQNVYLSPHDFENIVGSFDLRSEAPDDTEMLDLSQVRRCVQSCAVFECWFSDPCIIR